MSRLIAAENRVCGRSTRQVELVVLRGSIQLESRKHPRWRLRRPETWVTDRTGHMGNTFHLRWQGRWTQTTQEPHTDPGSTVEQSGEDHRIDGAKKRLGCRRRSAEQECRNQGQRNRVPVPLANLIGLASAGNMGDAVVRCGTFAN